jgi:DNA-binding transcriptional ArsR family regulator
MNAAAESKIAELAGRGISAAEIASRLGVSQRTVGRRLAALRGPLKPRQRAAGPRPAPTPASASEANVEPGDADDSEDTPARTLTDEELEQAALGGTGPLDELIRSIAGEYQRATSGPLKQRIAGDYLKALDLRRKMTPPPAVDPNDQPDMIALGRRVAERLHRMVDLVCEEARQG